MALTNDETQFVVDVSQKTGMDPRDLIAWIAQEGHPGDTAYNYMNITSTTARSLGEPVANTLAANTAGFANLQTGEDATVKEIKSLGLTREAGKTPAATISDIAATGWASSHYGGAGGPNLVATFESIFGKGSAQSAYQGSGSALAVASTAGTGSAADITSSTGASVISGAVSAITGPITSVEDAIKFVFSYRFLEILGGGVLILLGLYIVARQFQQTFLPPDPLGLGKRAVANEQQERTVVREQRAAEVHTARVAQTRARTTEIRSRSRARTTKARLTKEAAKREYNRGALDQATAEASPTMTKIRRQRSNT